MFSVANVKIFSLLIALALLGRGLFAQQPQPVGEVQTIALETAAPPEGINVLILGDSLALCGFGKRLDERFRKNPRVKGTFTYVACGTNPLSWLKERPYTNIKTHCGFISIESNGSGRPRELQDVYGMRRGHVPIPHAVPKLEDLLVALRPDILIMQTGTNLFDLFPDHKTVSPNRHGPTLKSYLVPFITKAARSPSTLRKIYWVASPTSGRVSKEIQDFVIQHPEHSPHYEYHLANPDDPKARRRSVYRFLVRSKPQPFMTVLDCADPSMQVDKRTETLSPLQALALFNNGFMLAQAKHLAERVKDSGGVAAAFRMALGREASATERQALEEYATQYGLANACRVILNLNEFVFVD